MINFDRKAFISELEKISVALNEEERRRQALQFAGLGAASGPVIGGVSNLVQHGRFGPPTGIPLKRWVPATMLTGALLSGALPVARHHLERSMQQQAKERSKMESLQKQLMTQVKSAAVKRGARIGGQILKTALDNVTGRDNRTPFVGGTQFPTEGSKSKAKALHTASVNKAEVGPAPLMGTLDKTKMTPLGSVVPKMPTSKGSLPNIGG